MIKSDQITKTIQGLFGLNAGIWLLLAILTAARNRVGPNMSGGAAWVVAILMAGNALVMLLSAWGIRRKQILYYYGALAVLALNIALTVTDEFGVLDLITLVIDLILLGLVLLNRRSLIGQTSTAAGLDS